MGNYFIAWKEFEDEGSCKGLPTLRYPTLFIRRGRGALKAETGMHDLGIEALDRRGKALHNTEFVGCVEGRFTLRFTSKLDVIAGCRNKSDRDPRKPSFLFCCLSLVVSFLWGVEHVGCFSCAQANILKKPSRECISRHR